MKPFVGGILMGEEKGSKIVERGGRRVDDGGGGGGDERIREDKMEKPPLDDCCPICFGDFTFPCKTNCGHWFCAGCILEFWHYRAAPQRCKCPICCRLISKLAPEDSIPVHQGDEVVRVLKSIQQYNCLYVGGVRGLLLKAQASPLLTRGIFQSLIDPDRFRINYYTMRFFALVLACLYHIFNFDFIPTGGMGVRRLFDICATALVCVFFLIGLCREWILKLRARRLPAMQS